MLLIIKVQPSYQTIFERAEMFLRAIGGIYLPVGFFAKNL